MVQKRKKAQFNLIDALIVLIILGLIGVSIYLIFGDFHKEEMPGNIDMTFEVRISGIKENMLPYITDGLEVKDSVMGAALGRIVAVRTEKSHYYSGVYENETGDRILGVFEHPDEYDVYVTISSGSKPDSRGIYTVGNIRMLIGETVHFQVKSFSAVSYIVNTDFSQNGESETPDAEDTEGNGAETSASSD